MGRNHLHKQMVPKDPIHLLTRPCDPVRPSGISLGFPRLSPSQGQLDYVLLARPPLYSSEDFHVRLACLIHAANVRSEPGSNPSLEISFLLDGSIQFFCRSRPSHRRRRIHDDMPARLAAAHLRTLATDLSVPSILRRQRSLTRFLSRPPRMSKIDTGFP